MSAIPITPEISEAPWKLPSKGMVGMACLITSESAIFIIFGDRVSVLHRQEPERTDAEKEVLDLPIVATICLLSSSFTSARRGLRAGERAR